MPRTTIRVCPQDCSGHFINVGEMRVGAPVGAVEHLIAATTDAHGRDVMRHVSVGGSTPSVLDEDLPRDELSI